MCGTFLHYRRARGADVPAFALNGMDRKIVASRTPETLSPSSCVAAMPQLVRIAVLWNPVYHGLAIASLLREPAWGENPSKTAKAGFADAQAASNNKSSHSPSLPLSLSTYIYCAYIYIYIHIYIYIYEVGTQSVQELQMHMSRSDCWLFST